MSLVGNQPEPLESEFDDKTGGNHRQVEGREQEPGHAPAVVLAVDVENWQDDQVSEDEGEDAAEADAAVPEHRRQWNVANRADEAEDRDEGSDDRSPELRERRVRLKEDRLPPRLRHPGGQGASDQ